MMQSSNTKSDHDLSTKIKRSPLSVTGMWSIIIVHKGCNVKSLNLTLTIHLLTPKSIDGLQHKVDTTTWLTQKQQRWCWWPWCCGWRACDAAGCPERAASTNTCGRSTWSSSCRGRNTAPAGWNTGCISRLPSTGQPGSGREGNIVVTQNFTMYSED